MSTHDRAAARAFLETNVTWLGQSGLAIRTPAGKLIVVDPLRVPHAGARADLILLTHSHGDHYAKKVVAALAGPDTRVVTPTSMPGAGTDMLAVGEEKTVAGVVLKAYPAYNHRGWPHPRKANWVGYRLTFDGWMLYHGGDTDSYDEITGMAPDIAFLPISGFMAFGIDEGAIAADAVGAALTVPIHYALIPGTSKNGIKFQKAYPEKSFVFEDRARDKKA